MNWHKALAAGCLGFLTALLVGLGSLPVYVLVVFPFILIFLSSGLPKPWVMFVFLGIFIIVGFFRGYIDSVDYSHAIGYAEGEYQGKLFIVDKQEDDRYIGKLEKAPGCKVLFFSKDDYVPGDTLQVKGMLVLPMNNLNEGGFSYLWYLRNKGIYFILDQKRCSKTGQIKSLNYLLYKYKEKYLGRMTKYLGEDIKYLKSTFLGDYGDLSETDIDNWRSVGITHLQAVSGAQVGALMDILMLIFIMTPRKGWIKTGIFIGFLVFYGLLTATPSVWRAILFYVFIRMFEYFRIKKNELTALLLSALVLLFLAPRYVFQISFQLSYIIAFGVILYKDVVDGKGVVLKALSAGGISMFFGLPLLLYYFQFVSLMTIIATPLISPIVQIIIIIGAFYLYLPFLIDFLIPMNFLLKGIIWMLNWFVGLLNLLPSINLRLGAWPIPIILTYYFFLILCSNKNFRKRFLKIVITGAGVLLLSIYIIPAKPKEYLEIDFINVNQGESILIITPDPKRSILIDGGRAFGTIDMGAREVIPYLQRKGIFKLDLVISTHSDNDHMGGLNSVLDDIPVGAIMIPPLEYDVESDYAQWREKYSDRIGVLYEGVEFMVGDVIFKVDAPSKVMGATNKNDASIVLEIFYGKSSVLLTADCELSLLESFAHSSDYFDLVKAPHHGSINSYRKNIYDDLDAKVVVFSVGENNYGHPSLKILEDLKKCGIPYFRTDKDKTIETKVYKNEIVIEGYKFKDR